MRVGAIAQRAVFRMAPPRLRQRMIERFVREGSDAVNRGEFEVILPRYAENVAFHVHFGDAVGPDIDDVYYGHDGIRAFYRQWLSGWDTWRGELERVFEHDERVFVIYRGIGAAGGIEVDRRMATVCAFDAGGLISREDNYLAAKDALAEFDVPALMT